MSQMKQMMKGEDQSYNANEKDTEAIYLRNCKTHKVGITNEECVSAYNKWMTYDQDMDFPVYKGPKLAAEAVRSFFDKSKNDALILDVACGSGKVGHELNKLGFTRLHGLDPCESLLKIARESNIYEQLFCEYLDDRKLNIIENDHYDCAVIAGGMGEGHIPSTGLPELARIVKKDGLVCIVMREEYLQKVADYKDNLQAVMTELENAGIWRTFSISVVSNYSFNKNGIVYMFAIL